MPIFHTHSVRRYFVALGRPQRLRSVARRVLADESGQATPLMFTAIGLALLFGVIVVDVGLIYGERRQAQAAADFAALAAAQDLPRSSADPDLATKLNTAEATAYDYLRRNGYDPSDPDVSALALTSYGGEVDKIEITVSRPRAWLLGRLFGLGDLEISGRAVAAQNGVARDVMVVLDNSGSMCLLTHGGPRNDCTYPHESAETVGGNPIQDTVPAFTGDMVVVGAMAGNTGTYTAGNGFSVMTTQIPGSMTFSTAQMLSNGGGETPSMSHTNPNRQALVLATLTREGIDVGQLGSWETDLDMTAPAGTNRALIFVAGWEDGGDRDLDWVRYGDRDLDRIVKRQVDDGTNGGVEMWVLYDADITTAIDENFTFCWNTTPSAFAYAHAFFDNVQQGGTAQYEPFDTVAAAALDFAQDFKPYVEGVPFDHLGIVSYNWDAQLELGLTLDYLGAGSAYDITVNSIVSEGRTNIGHSIYVARTTLASTGTPGSAKVIVLLSDGLANVYLDPSSSHAAPVWINGGAGAEADDYARDQATQAAQVGMAIYTIGLTENAGEQLLRDIADIGNTQGAGGKFFDVDDPAELEGTFEQIADLINYALVE